MNLLCFPSDEPLRDLLLPLHLRPDVVFVADVDGHGRAEALTERLLAHGLETVALAFPSFGACADHEAVLMETLAPLLESAGEPEIVLALGDCGGPWELSCQRFLKGLLRAGEFQVLVLLNAGRNAARVDPGPVAFEEVPSLLEPADYLAACSATLRRSVSEEAAFEQRVGARRALTLLLARECAALGPALGTLNYLATQAVDRDGEALVEPKQHLPKAPASPLRAALAAMVEAGVLDHDGDRELIFRSAEACRFVAGGWLEEYAWLTASELDAEHVHAGLELTWNAGPGIAPRNELDLFVLHRNRALTVECKTSTMGDGDPTAQILYKLDSIADRLSSLPGNAALLSAREVPDLIVKRARAQDVTVFDAERLIGFRDWLGEWLAG
ncbi:DUF1887 family protein [Wenzhouxiangella sp. XN79A]|uniref:Card1-like endonuclease domain-containing protein n=1 Tax=Wenzhouxiangella sp. XN79A TaxID=2724193 RepID=UPI00144AC305|nr:DUF1887 family CARF protein [Wenzhouxiangella sp. XN79A]NKI33898.1 DUF1887 family protein [Wenzhouxiangella sp. XN79A]